MLFLFVLVFPDLRCRWALPTQATVTGKAQPTQKKKKGIEKKKCQDFVESAQRRGVTLLSRPLPEAFLKRGVEPVIRPTRQQPMGQRP